jgi:predicted metal-dependent hydrolase
MVVVAPGAPRTRQLRALEDNEETMSLEWNNGALVEGLQCYQNEEFFRAHEHWEGVWLIVEEPEKTFLQALIQVAAAFHHFQRKNLRGAASLLQAALRRLGSFPAVYEGIEVESLRKCIREWLRVLPVLDGSPRPPYPRIR